jgi:hypothetical protein
MQDFLSSVRLRRRQVNSSDSHSLCFFYDDEQQVSGSPHFSHVRFYLFGLSATTTSQLVGFTWFLLFYDDERDVTGGPYASHLSLHDSSLTPDFLSSVCL